MPKVVSEKKSRIHNQVQKQGKIQIQLFKFTYIRNIMYLISFF